LSNHISE
jgi:hypothetical protein